MAYVVDCESDSRSKRLEDYGTCSFLLDVA